MFKTSTSLTILSMSFIKSRLDISPGSATKKKPCRESNRALLFSARHKLAVERDGNNKAIAAHPRCNGFFFRLQPLADHATTGSVILQVFTPDPPMRG